MKKLMKIWTLGLASSPHTFTRAQSREINKRLNKIRNALPSEFERRSRSLSDISTWKAVEYRTFLLYTGEVVFILPVVWNRHAEQYLLKFVKGFAGIYGKHNLIFNVHSLLHLAKDCLIHGPLDNFSSFPHESLLNRLKRVIFSRNRPLAQLIRRQYFV